MLVITVALLNFGVSIHFVEHQMGVEGVNIMSSLISEEAKLASALVFAQRVQPVVSLPTNNRPLAFFTTEKVEGPPLDQLYTVPHEKTT
jgi:hypothetical protein